jgi:hypothetical protein
MNLPDDPYSHLKATEKVKFQAYVDQADKEILMTVIPNRNLYTLLLTHCIKRAADFVRSNNLEYSNVQHQQRLLHFVINGCDIPSEDGVRKRATPRAPRKANARDDAGGNA